VQADAKSLFAEDENFTVKALKAVNEIIAVYRVDDQNIEMAIRLPPMFPLRKVDVNGVQKVGVDEKRWRAWLLAVSAIIVSQVK
jgi:E3 ubiquitin-protein ligase listerin